MKRTRTNSSVLETFPGNTDLSYTGDVSPVYFGWTSRPGSGSYPETFSKVSEYMYDEDHGFRSLNPCYHDRTVRELGPRAVVPCSAWKFHDGTWKKCFDWKVMSLTSQYSWTPLSTLLGGSVVTSHVATDAETWNIPDYRAEAWENIRPQVEAELSLLNSVYELKDFKRLPELLRKTDQSLHRVFDLVIGEKRSLSNIAKGKTLKQLLGVGSGHYLNYMFAVAPLVSDVRALSGALKAAKKGIKSLYERANRVHTSHWTKPIEPDEIGFEEVSEDDAAMGRTQECCSYKVVETLQRCQYTATVRYRFTLPIEMSRLAAILGRLDALGVNLNPAIIWNAIPFSFVVDWFLKIGPALDKLKWTALPVDVKVYGMCHSLRYEVAKTVYCYPYSYQNTPEYKAYNPSYRFERGMSRVEMASLHRSVYIRKPCGLPFVPIPKLSGFSNTEKWLSGALISSMYASKR